MKIKAQKLKISDAQFQKWLAEIKKIDREFERKIFAIRREQRAVIEKIIKRIDGDKIAEIRKKIK